MPDQPLEDLFARLDRERQDADRRYNDALTVLDRAIAQLPPVPAAPLPFDDRQIAAINREWNILPDGGPRLDRSFKGRLRAFVWRIVGPPLDAQKQFNASLVEHLNRNVRGQQELPITLGAMIEEAISEGRRELHFLRGGEAYKYAWGAADRMNASLRLARGRNC